MRKLKLQMQFSIDGYVPGVHHERSWMEWNRDKALKEYVTTLTHPVDTILLGRKLAEAFIPVWKQRDSNPATRDELSTKVANIPKFVFTRTLSRCIWDNSELVHNDLAKTVRVLKEQDGGDLIAYGGAEFAESLIKNDLIDDYHIFINPSAMSNGLKVFSRMATINKVRLLHCQRFNGGIAVLHYGKQYL